MPSRRRAVRGAWRGAGVALVALFAWPFAGALSQARTTSALRVELSGAPQAVYASDGREHIEYDLVSTNAFTADAALRSVEVRADGRILLSLRGAALAAATLTLGTSKPTDGNVAPSSSVMTQVDVVLPRSAGRRVPRRLTNQIRYALPADAPVRAVIGSTTVDVPPAQVDRQAPVLIAPPLRGTGWLDANGCCDDATAPHRQTVLATSSGAYVTPEMFAIDWVRVVNGRLFSGDGSRNSEWPTFGAPVYAVAAGTVVTAVNNRPDIPPRTTNPLLQGPSDFGGNRVLLRIRAGRFACYAHMIPGSVRVRPGQRVRAGQRIGLVGNSGNTTGPHLHFGIQRRPDCLSESEPFEFARYTRQGTVAPAAAPGAIRVTGPPRRQRRAFPLILSVDDYQAPARPRR